MLEKLRRFFFPTYTVEVMNLKYNAVSRTYREIQHMDIFGSELHILLIAKDRTRHLVSKADREFIITKENKV